MREIVVYTTPVCPHCRALKAWLEANGYPYTERNLLEMSADEIDALVEKAGGLETPITCVGDECRCGMHIDWIRGKEERGNDV